MGNDPLRRDASPVELTDSFDLIRREAGQVAVNLVDGGSFFKAKDKNAPGISPRGLLKLKQLPDHTTP
jgi:predicted NUDIX family NTP pyrophosphohydrolase